MFWSRWPPPWPVSRPTVWTSSTSMPLTTTHPLRRHWGHANSSTKVREPMLHVSEPYPCYVHAEGKLSCSCVYEDIISVNRGKTKGARSVKLLLLACGMALLNLSRTCPYYSTILLRLMSITSVRGMDGCCPPSTRGCTTPSQGRTVLR